MRSFWVLVASVASLTVCAQTKPAASIPPPVNVHWQQPHFDKATGVWVVGTWSDRIWEAPTGDDLKKSVLAHGYMDKMEIAHLPDGSEVVTFGGRLPETVDEDPPSYTAPGMGTLVPAAAELPKVEATSTNAVVHHTDMNWFTHRLKPSAEVIRSAAAAIYGAATARITKFRVIRTFVKSHRNIFGKLIPGYWKVIRIKM